MPTNSYECAISGVHAEGEFHFKNDKLGDLPVGWVQVTIKRRSFNPRWIAIQQAKEASVALIMAQLPKQISAEVRASQEQMLRLQQEAHYYNLEKDTPVYVTSEEVVYVADPQNSSDVREAFNDARAGLNLGPMGFDTDLVEDKDEQDVDDEDDEEGEEEGEDDEDDDDEDDG
jgi:phosphopantothenoylcysteine synthetase/decarboxylase